MDLTQFQSGAGGAPPAAPGAPSAGYPQAGNPGTGTPATKPGPYWFYQVLAEMKNLIEAAGLVPSHADLTQLSQAVQRFAPAVPLAALQYPTIATADFKVGATSALEAGTGGKVSIPANIRFTLGREATAGATGRLQAFVTAAWTSASLDVNSTYYLRGQVDGAGAWTPYVQKGTDADAIPGGLKGTPNGANSGGFDSTVLDILLAKVVTGNAGTTPTVTNLANAAVLAARFAATVTGSTPVASAWQVNASHTFTTNWARTPRSSPVRGVARSSGGSVALQGWANYMATVTVDRYAAQLSCNSDWFDAAPNSPYNVDFQYDPVA